MSKKEIITLCDVDFEVVNGKVAKKRIIERLNNARMRGWYDLSCAYGRCSWAKHEIWEKWRERFYKIADSLNSYCCLYVAGAGSCFFSISAEINGNVFFITPSHNYIVRRGA